MRARLGAFGESRRGNLAGRVRAVAEALDHPPSRLGERFEPIDDALTGRIHLLDQMLEERVLSLAGDIEPSGDLPHELLMIALLLLEELLGEGLMALTLVLREGLMALTLVLGESLEAALGKLDRSGHRRQRAAELTQIT
jgi:hypothetical protein